jgi:hypothetical protein
LIDTDGDANAKKKIEDYSHVVTKEIRTHAYLYIEKVASSEVVDRSAFQQQENSIYLPYRDVSFFYGEYRYSCKYINDPICASISTFRRAFKAVVAKFDKEGHKLKLSGGKGKDVYMLLRCNVKCLTLHTYII